MAKAEVQILEKKFGRVQITTEIKNMTNTNFNDLIKSLESGNSTITSIGDSQKLRVVREKIDGKETGLVAIKSVGGKVSRKIAENTLLSGFQSLAVRKGLFEFGGEAVQWLAEMESPTDAQSELIAFAIEPRFLNSIVSRFLKQIGLVLITTDLQAIEILQAVCKSELETAKAIRPLSDEMREQVAKQVTAYNDAVIAEREATKLALTANS